MAPGPLFAVAPAVAGWPTIVGWAASMALGRHREKVATGAARASGSDFERKDSSS